MSTEIRNKEFERVVGTDVAVEQIGTGYSFTEGPIWHPYEKHLVFSDMPGDCMRKWTADEGVNIFRRPSNMANGNAYDRRGRIVTCEHSTSRVTRTEKDGSIVTLASHYRGKELNSPNDIIVTSDGSIYFTDPMFGRYEYFGVLREPELDFRGVYRIPPDGSELELLLDDFDQPNGLTFSPDESLFYVNDTTENHIRVFDVRKHGSIGNGRVFAKVVGDGQGAADGLKTDSEGNVYCTGPGGIHVFDSDGECLGVVFIPEHTANFQFGGEDMRSVFVTASTSLYRFRVKVPGKKPF